MPAHRPLRDIAAPRSHPARRRGGHSTGRARTLGPRLHGERCDARRKLSQNKTDDVRETITTRLAASNPAPADEIQRRETHPEGPDAFRRRGERHDMRLEADVASAAFATSLRCPEPPRPTVDSRLPSVDGRRGRGESRCHSRWLTDMARQRYVASGSLNGHARCARSSRSGHWWAYSGQGPAVPPSSVSRIDGSRFTVNPPDKRLEAPRHILDGKTRRTHSGLAALGLGRESSDRRGVGTDMPVILRAFQRNLKPRITGMICFYAEQAFCA